MKRPIMMHYLYECEHGERLTIQPLEPSALFREQQRHSAPIFGRTAEISSEIWSAQRAGHRSLQVDGECPDRFRATE